MVIILTPHRLSLHPPPSPHRRINRPLSLLSRLRISPTRFASFPLCRNGPGFGVLAGFIKTKFTFQARTLCSFILLLLGSPISLITASFIALKNILSSLNLRTCSSLKSVDPSLSILQAFQVRYLPVFI